MNSSAVLLRRVELAVLATGLLIALVAMAVISSGAFESNMAWTEGTERLMAFAFTLFSLLFVGAIIVSPYVVLAFLGNLIKGAGTAGAIHVGGLVVSCVVTIASAYLYYESVKAITAPGASSTASIVMVAVPVVLLIAGGGAYGVLVLLHLAARKESGA